MSRNHDVMERCVTVPCPELLRIAEGLKDVKDQLYWMASLQETEKLTQKLEGIAALVAHYGGRIGDIAREETK